eukprot:6195011-Pleurochrysis_carterae.AAC.2
MATCHVVGCAVLDLGTEKLPSGEKLSRWCSSGELRGAPSAARRRLGRRATRRSRRNRCCEPTN